MSLLLDTLPDLFGGLGSAAVIGGAVLVTRHLRRNRDTSRPRRPVPQSTQERAEGVTSESVGVPVDLVKARRYTLLGTIDNVGHPVQITTTRLAGTVITRTVAGREMQFELTAAPLYDGTFAAEPVD